MSLRPRRVARPVAPVASAGAPFGIARVPAVSMRFHVPAPAPAARARAQPQWRPARTDASLAKMAARVDDTEVFVRSLDDEVGLRRLFVEHYRLTDPREIEQNRRNVLEQIRRLMVLDTSGRDKELVAQRGEQVRQAFYQYAAQAEANRAAAAASEPRASELPSADDHRDWAVEYMRSLHQAQPMEP